MSFLSKKVQEQNMFPRVLHTCKKIQQPKANNKKIHQKRDGSLNYFLNFEDRTMQFLLLNQYTII